MPEWRPDGWKNPYNSPEPAWYDNMSADHEDAYEDGADAMLEALRKKGREEGRRQYDYELVSIADGRPVTRTIRGQLVFIPDDKESKHIDEPTPTCPGLHNCEKIKMIADKDLLPEQYSTAVREVCRKCREEANG